MGSLAYLGQFLGKQAQSLRLLIIAALVMLLVNPLTIFDVGFQLSFLATLGLIVLCPRLTRVPTGIRESLAAQIFVWPVLVSNFGQMNVFAILINSLIVWLVPYIMVLGAALSFTGWQVLAWLVYVPAHLMVKIIYVFA
jgi:competence protein ComEC